MYTDEKKKRATTVSEHLQMKPEEFQWDNQELLDQKTDAWLSREKFEYDYSNDPLYQQYKEQYAALGDLAMQDTMGQAAAMTGGYANSYAQTVGQQTYQQYMDQLNSKLPELYGIARSNYDAEGQDLYNQIALLEGQRAQAYSEYQAGISEWYNYLSYLQQEEANRIARASASVRNSTGSWLDDIPDEVKDALATKDKDNIESYLSSLADAGVIDPGYVNPLRAIYSGGYTDLGGVDEKIIKQAHSYPNWTEAEAYLMDIMKNSPGALADDQAVEILAQGPWTDQLFHKAELVDDATSDGSLVWRVGENYVTRKKGENPYTGTINDDIENGAFSNGYQPNNVYGSKLKKTKDTTEVNGVEQTVWEDENGNLWYWDGTKNRYLHYVKK